MSATDCAKQSADYKAACKILRAHNSPCVDLLIQVMAQPSDSESKSIERVRHFLENSRKCGGTVTVCKNVANLLWNPASDKDSLRGSRAAYHWTHKMYTMAAYGHSDPEAKMKLAGLFEEGYRGRGQALDIAEELYSEIIAMGQDTDGNALCRLGKILYKGMDKVKKDEARATSLFRKAVEQKGNVEACYYLACTLQDHPRCSDGEHQDEVKELLERSVSGIEIADAMFRLAECILKEDKCRAVSLLERAISLEHHVKAKVKLARILIQGTQGIERNVLRASELCKEVLATESNADALFVMGFLENDPRTASALFVSGLRHKYDWDAVVALAHAFLLHEKS